MNHRRAILALFVVAATIAGTTGFSTVQSDRTVDVQVADDTGAYLKLVETGDEIENGTTGEALNLTNQFAEPVELSVSVTVEDGDITNRGLTDQNIDSGGTASLEVRCQDSQTTPGTITVDVEASGDEISFEKSGKEVTVNCG
jgi:hypothetical protein